MEKKKFHIFEVKIKRLAEVIDQVGLIQREVDADLFSSVVHHIIGQQISTKAQATIWKRMQEMLGEVNAETILSADISRLQSFGMTFRKAEYISDFARKVHDGTVDLDAVWQMSDEDAIRELSSLKGIGVWTAEMILLFCMQRQIFSAMMILQFSVDCVWSIITGKLTGNYLKDTVAVSVHIAAWQAFTFGQCRAVQFRE